MLLPSHQEINRFISRCRVFLISGTFILFCQFLLPAGWKIGFLTGFTLFAAGVFGFALRRWRTECGLWMLASLLTVIYVPSIAYFEFLHWREIARLVAARGAGWPQIRLMIDATTALLIASDAVKIITGIAWENTRMKRSSL
jgi:hypothetical protein